MLEAGSLDFTHNPLSWPPPQVVAKGLTAIRNYMEPKWRDLQEFKRRKMFYDSLQANKNRNLNKVRCLLHIRCYILGLELLGIFSLLIACSNSPFIIIYKQGSLYLHYLSLLYHSL